jgi:hypothetical protein
VFSASVNNSSKVLAACSAARANDQQVLGKPQIPHLDQPHGTAAMRILCSLLNQLRARNIIILPQCGHNPTSVLSVPAVRAEAKRAAVW